MPVNIEYVTQVDNALRDMARVNQSFTDMHKVNQDAAGALGVFGVSLSALNNPITAVASGIKDSIDTTTKWADTIDKLSRASGESAAETSKMAVVFEDFGISADGLDKTIKTFTKNGLQFNLDTIKKLAVQYQAIKDPVEKDKFAFDNFGKSGLEMTEILSKTPAELEAIGNAAMYSGKIMDEQGVAAAQHFGLEVKQLGDDLDGLKIAVGGPLIEGLTRAIDGWRSLQGIMQIGGIVVEKTTGLISQDQAAARLAAAANGDLFAAFHNATTAAAQLNPALAVMVNSQSLIADNTNASAVAYEGFTPLVNNLTDAQQKAADATDAATLAAKNNTEMLAVNAGMSGTVTSAVSAYKDTIQGSQVEIDKLTTEISKYQGLQGDTVTITTEATATQNEYELGVLKAAEAQKAYNEYTGDDAIKKLELAVASDTASASVVKLGESMGTAQSVTLDYTTKIAEDKDALNDLVIKQGEAKDQLDKTTGAFILQNLAMTAAPAAQLEIARSLGLIDEKSYDLALRVQGLTKDWDLNKNGMIDAGAEADGLSGALHNQQLGVEAAAGALPDLQGHIEGVGGAAHHAAGDVGELKTAEDSLYDKIVKIETDFINKTYGSGGPGYEPPHNAAGGQWTIPPGYSNDTFPLGALGTAQSGEVVTITPANQAGKANSHAVTIYVDARNSIDPDAVEAAGYRGAQRALAEAGYRADGRMRMGVS